MISELRKRGDVGEKIAKKFLMKQGFVLVTSNYWRPFGEIDLIVTKNGLVHFVEVKTIYTKTKVIYETDLYRPEDNFHEAKRKRMGKAVSSYCIENNIRAWQADLVALVINSLQSTVKIRFIEDIVL